MLNLITERVPIEYDDSVVAVAFRNVGYNNYAAIADITDNSIEPDVNSSIVNVELGKEGKGNDTKVSSISIIDNGGGMEKETLNVAMRFGSRTGKEGTRNLGMYGLGLKAAGLSLGRKLEVFSKTEDSELYYASLVIGEDGVPYSERGTIGLDSEEYRMFKKATGTNHGTIVKISDLDRLKNKNFYSFKNTLKGKLGEYFNKFILAGVVKFYVCGEEVPYVNLMGNYANLDQMGEETFSVDGHEMRGVAYYIPKNGIKEEDGHETSSSGEEYLRRTLTYQGIYIYRNNRLVGQGLTLGLWTKDTWLNGFRYELYVDGNCDYLFDSSFNKMVGEKSKSDISEELACALGKHMKPYLNEAKKRDHREAKEEADNDPVRKKELDEFYKKVTEKQNKNMMLRANRKGVNHKKEEEDEEKEHKTRGPQKNPNPTKNRTNKWLDSFEERPLGAYGDMYSVDRTGCKVIVVINTDHAFYKKFYSQLDNDLKFIMAQMISCSEIAKLNMNYYDSSEVESIINSYDAIRATEISKSLNF